MKSKKYIPLTFVIVCEFLGFGFTIGFNNIAGKLELNPQDKSAYVEGVNLILKAESKIVSRTQANEKGEFEFPIIDKKHESYDVFAYGIAIDTIYLGTLKTEELSRKEISLFIPAQRTQNILGSTKCPKCSKADRVYKIRYGDGALLEMKVTKADTTYSSLVNGKYYAGTCIVGVAKFYCNRDKIEF